MTERLHFHFSLSCIREGNGNPLQCSCLENRRDGGAWWAAVYGVTQSRTRLKQLSSSRNDSVVRGHAGSILWRSPYYLDEQCLKCWGLFRGSKEGRCSRRCRCPSGQEGTRQPWVREQSLVQVEHISWAKGVVKDKGAHRLGQTVNSHEL